MIIDVIVVFPVRFVRFDAFLCREFILYLDSLLVFAFTLLSMFTRMEGEEKCQSSFRNLLRMPERDGSEMATIWIREFMQATAKCDQFHDLSVRRAAWRKHLGEDAYNKIMSFDQTDPSVPESCRDIVSLFVL